MLSVLNVTIYLKALLIFIVFTLVSIYNHKKNVRDTMLLMMERLIVDSSSSIV